MRYRKLAVIALAFAAVAALPTVARRTFQPRSKPRILTVGTAATSTGTAEQLCVLAFNIAHGGRYNGYRERADALAHLSRLGATIEGSGADLVLLSEVDLQVRGSHEIDQARMLAEIAHYPFVATGLGYDVWTPIFAFRTVNAVLSKRPILRGWNHALPPAGWQRFLIGGRRGLEVAVDLGGGNVANVYALHLDSNGPGDMREKQVNELVPWIRKPAILGGDLNAVPMGWEDNGRVNKDDHTLALLAQAGLHGLEGDTDDPRLRTFPADAPTGRIDHVLASEPFRVVSVKAIETRESDHRALLTCLALGPAP